MLLGSAVPLPARAGVPHHHSLVGLILVLVYLQCSRNHKGTGGEGSASLTESCLPAGIESQPLQAAFPS